MRAPLFCLSLVLAASCGGEPPPAPRSPAAQPVAARAPRPEPKVAPPAPPGSGSSDGMTCDEAREQHGDEVAIGKQGGADLSSREFSKVLNHGEYLTACEVPTDVSVEVCAAVKEGRALGVTIVMSPANPDLEKCVSARVRELGFPVSSKLDVVRTRF
ncbi:MAG: hypothetical protein IT374_10595 [Polyangiaceae bacterium]|nr:hypothetical protein [Polyangiaceae bacterium]